LYFCLIVKKAVYFFCNLKHNSNQYFYGNVVVEKNNYTSHHDAHHSHSLYDELICHLPYAIFSVAAALTVVSFVMQFEPSEILTAAVQRRLDVMFHSFHFMHIVFAATGTMLTFMRYSKNIALGIVVGLLSPAFFCMLSDAILPYFGGLMFGMDMQWHICFVSEIHNVVPFLLVGIINGIVMSKHHSSRQSLYSVFSHFVHILVSSLASTFYIVSHGFGNWYEFIGYLFLFLICAVVVPCTFSDVVVPMMVAKGRSS